MITKHKVPGYYGCKSTQHYDVTCDECGLLYEFYFNIRKNHMYCPQCACKQIIADELIDDIKEYVISSQKNYISFKNRYENCRDILLVTYRKSILYLLICLTIITITGTVSIVISNKYIELFLIVSMFAIIICLYSLKYRDSMTLDYYLFKSLKNSLDEFLVHSLNTKLNNSNYLYKHSIFKFSNSNYISMFDDYYERIVDDDLKNKFKHVSIYSYILNKFHSNDALDCLDSFKYKDEIIMN